MRYITWNDNLTLLQNNGDIRMNSYGEECFFRFYELILGNPTSTDVDGVINFDQSADGDLVTSTDDKRLNLGHKPSQAAYKLSTRAFLPVAVEGDEIPAPSDTNGEFWFKILGKADTGSAFGANAIGTIMANTDTDPLELAEGDEARLIGWSNWIAAGYNLQFFEAPDITVDADSTLAESGLIPNNIYKVLSGVVFYEGQEYRTGEFFKTGSEPIGATPFGAGTNATYYRYIPEPHFSALSENNPLYEVENFKQKVLGSGKEVAGYYPNRVPTVAPHTVQTVYKK